MKKLIIAAAIANIFGSASLARADPEHHTGQGVMPVAHTQMDGHTHHNMHAKHRKMHCKHGADGMQGMSGGQDMMGNGGMDHDRMHQMHDHMGNDGMMGGGKMGNMAPSATPTPVAPK